MTRHTWTEEEKQLLIKLREEEGLTFSEMTKYFEGQTRQSLNTRYNHITKNKSNSKRTNKAWTTEEEEFLEKYYKEDYEFLMDNLPNRTRVAIAGKIAHLGLKRPSNEVLTEEGKRFILNNYKDLKQHELAESLNVDRGVVRRFLSKNKLTQPETVWKATKFEVDKDNIMTINVQLRKVKEGVN